MPTVLFFFGPRKAFVNIMTVMRTGPRICVKDIYWAYRISTSFFSLSPSQPAPSSIDWRKKKVPKLLIAPNETFYHDSFGVPPARLVQNGRKFSARNLFFWCFDIVPLGGFWEGKKNFQHIIKITKTFIKFVDP